MSLQTDKIELAKSLLETKSEALVKQVKAVIKSYESDLWDELSDYQKNCVMEAQEELKKGKGIAHKDVMKKYKKWLTK